MRLWISFLLLAGLALGGPVEFGMSEVQAAIGAKSVRIKISSEMSLDPPEAFRIEPVAGGARVTGGDLRGLMYGLLEAADQIRANGKLKAARFTPATRIRGVRMVLTAADLSQPWASSEDFWRDYLQTLARGRINRFNLVIPRMQGQLFWLRRLPPMAAEYGVDFTFGLSELSSTADDLRATLENVLANAPLIRGVELSAITGASADLFIDGIYAALKSAGRRVTLDLHQALDNPELAKAALDLGIPLRVSSDAGCGERTVTAESFCGPGEGYEFYWEVHEPPSPEDQQAVEMAVPVFSSKDAAGFEIDVPRSHLGGSPDQWAFQDHSVFYMLWGRLSYDPKYVFPVPPHN